MENQLQSAPIVDLHLGVRIGLETNNTSGQYRVSSVRGTRGGEEVHIILKKAHEFDKACAAPSAKELIDRGILAPIHVHRRDLVNIADRVEIDKMVHGIHTAREENLSRAISEAKDLPTKMEMLADEIGGSECHELRRLAKILRDAIADATTPPRRILGHWARARRAFNEHYEKSLYGK